jgi:hypothetical protein
METQEMVDVFCNDDDSESAVIQNLGGYGYVEESQEETKEERIDLVILEREAREYFKRSCPTQDEINSEMHVSEYEQLQPFEAGPWLVTVRKFDGYDKINTPVLGVVSIPCLVDEYDVGYEGTMDTTDDMPSNMECEHLSYENGQEYISDLEKAVDNAIVHEEIKGATFKRMELYGKMLRWVDKASGSEVARNANRFWNKLNASRAACSETGKWFQVILTKKQVEVINYLIRSKCGWKDKG